jgi:hypothetical protein
MMMAFDAKVLRLPGDQNVRAAQNDLKTAKWTQQQATAALEAAQVEMERANNMVEAAEARMIEVTGHKA